MRPAEANASVRLDSGGLDYWPPRRDIGFLCRAQRFGRLFETSAFRYGLIARSGCGRRGHLWTVDNSYGAIIAPYSEPDNLRWNLSLGGWHEKANRGAHR